MRKKLLQHTLFAAIAAWAIYLAQGSGPEPEGAGLSQATGWAAAPAALAWR